jgi:hypothetical protein
VPTSQVKEAPAPAARAQRGAQSQSPAAAPAESEAIVTWRAILERVRAARPAVAATLELAAPLTVSKERIVLAFEQASFEDGRASEMDAKDLLTAEARAFFMGQTQVTFEVARGTKAGSIAYLDKAKKKQAQIEARAAIEKHELVQKAIAIFDAELKDVRLPAQED